MSGVFGGMGSNHQNRRAIKMRVQLSMEMIILVTVEFLCCFTKAASASGESCACRLMGVFLMSWLLGRGCGEELILQS